DQRLASEISSLVIVPVVFGRDDAVTDEDELGLVEVRAARCAAGPREEILGPLERLEPPIALEHERTALGRDANQRHALNVTAVGSAGLHAEASQLADDILDRQLFALGSGTATLELV